ncbi:MAG: prolipoprotein diacylglyceryl transferase [Myxococcales bacterium]|nr:prolipoprotein diacylglyceryl transferase [Myxococcales bacterium]MCB9719053.1 prolipoprotein diacylglyceryl transferase [Myxococcales bacterium]
MLEALIPYITAPEKTLVEDMPLLDTPLKLQFFGPLVATGVIVGWYRCLKYARLKDLDELLFRDYLFWLLVSAFTISHWVSVIFYFPHQIEENPWVLLQVWNGLSSVGGFFGAFVGMMLYLRWYCARQKDIGPQPVMVYADATIFGLLAGWCFGRAGCSLVHDHPGKIVPEGTFLAVGPWPDGTWRYDLGLVEFMFAVCLMAFVYFVTKWDKWPPGRLVGLVATAYAPFRFFLDSLRADEAARGVIQTPDERYLGLTPAQWFTIAFLLVGLWLLLIRKPKPSDFEYAKDSARRKREEAQAAKGDDEGSSRKAAKEDDEDEDDGDDDGDDGHEEAEENDDDDDEDEERVH